MQPTTFPIMAEARMAERLLEVERERLARIAATTGGSLGRKPTASRRGIGLAHPLSPRSMAAVTLVGSLVLGGLSAVATGSTDGSALAPSRTDPDTVRPALVSGGWLCLSHGWCEARLNDPRVSAEGPIFDVTAPSVGDEALKGTIRVPGPSGDWVGPVAVIWDVRPGAADTFIGAGHVLGTEGVFALHGTAAYEGWAFVGTWSDPMTGDPAKVRGVIYEGQAPDLEGLLQARPMYRASP